MKLLYKEQSLLAELSDKKRIFTQELLDTIIEQQGQNNA